MNISIWVIAFGMALSAGNDGMREQRQPGARPSATAMQLIHRFREIGSNIGALRLTQ